MTWDVRPIAARCALAVVCALAIGCGRSDGDRLAEVRAMQQRGEFYATLEPLRKLIAERPDDPELHFLYGHALTQAGHVTQGAWSLGKAMEDPKWRLPAGLELGYGELKIRSYDAAIGTAERLLESEPDNVEALLLRAEARALAKRDLEAALTDADRALELDPDRTGALKPRILALLALHRIGEAEYAIDDLGKRLEETEGGSELAGWHCATKAVFREEQVSFGDAPPNSEPPEDLWRGCLETFPADPEVVAHALEFYDARGERDRGVTILRAALAENPTATDYRSDLAERLRDAGETQQAEDLLREAAGSEDPYVAVAAGVELAEHFQATGAYAAGVAAIDRAVEQARALGPVHPQLLFEQADALVLAGDLDRALAVAEEMSLAAHRELVRARVAQQRGDFAAANRHYDEAFRLWPDNPAARFNAALAAEANGEFDRAIEQYRYAIRVEPQDVEARTRLARLHLAEGKPEAALEILRLHKQPLDFEGELLALRLTAQTGATARVNAALARMSDAKTPERARALASVAEGFAARDDSEAAVRLLRDHKGVRLADPEAADALRALVRASHGAGRLGDAIATVRAALAGHPDAATAHEILGLALELSGGPPEQARAAYARALELDPAESHALRGLARLALARDPGEAQALFDRAAAADPDDVEARQGAARALVALGRSGEAEQRLAKLVVEHPLAGGAAAQLAALQLERRAASDETVALARRAIRLRDPGGWDLLQRAHAQRGDAEKAAKAAKAAERARAERDRGHAGPAVSPSNG